MMTIMTLSLAILIFMSMFSMNPMKMIYIMMIMMGVVSAMMMLQLSSPWVSMIMFLLFMGGILISFMMIASMMPNEKSLSMDKMVIATIPTLIMISSMPEEHTSNMSLIITVMETNYNLLFLSISMVMYFLTFILMISQLKQPLRTLSC